MEIDLWPGGGKYAGLFEIDFGIKPGDKVLDVDNLVVGNNELVAGHTVEVPGERGDRGFSGGEVVNQQDAVFRVTVTVQILALAPFINREHEPVAGDD